jgi:hypothetical protein
MPVSLTAAPPMTPRRSKTATERPALARSAAHARPLCPAPITTASYEFLGRDVVDWLAIRGPRREAIPAIHRLVAARIERNLRYATALTARRSEHFTWTAAATFATALIRRTHGFARLTTIGATVRLVLKTFLLVKALFARAEDELTSAVYTVEHFIDVHETRNSLDSTWLGFELDSTRLVRVN